MEAGVTLVSAYTPYDLLRTLVERVGWPQETEKRAALESTVAEHEGDDDW